MEIYSLMGLEKSSVHIPSFTTQDEVPKDLLESKLSAEYDNGYESKLFVLLILIYIVHSLKLYFLTCRNQEIHHGNKQCTSRYIFT